MKIDKEERHRLARQKMMRQRTKKKNRVELEDGSVLLLEDGYPLELTECENGDNRRAGQTQDSIDP